MDEKRFLDLKHKIEDYTRFSFVLLFLSAFMAIGSLIPFQGKTNHDKMLLSLTAAALILISMGFYRRVVKIKEQLNRDEKQ